VEGIVSEMAGVTECSNQERTPVSSCDDRFEVIVRQEGHDDVGPGGQPAKGLEVGSNVGKSAFFAQTGQSPGQAGEPALEIGPSDKQEPGFVIREMQGSAPVFGYRCGTGELVRGDGQTYAHGGRIKEKG